MGRTWAAPRRSAAVVATSGLILALLAGCGSEAGEPDTSGRDNEPSEATRTGSPGDTPDAELAVSEVAGDLTSPWGVVELDGGDLLVNERDTGEIVRVDRASGARTTVTVIPGVMTGSESGLLGLTITPAQDEVLAYYTGEDDSRVVSMSWDGRSLGEPTPVLTDIPTGAGYHQGGRILVGPDGLLYVGTGDNGVPENAQDPDSLSGKVLRVTLDGKPAPDNPSGTPVYSLGHRNVQGLALDDQGRLWEAEFGDAAWDEVNLIEPGGNYGWPAVEGSGGETPYVDPAAVWRTGDASPSGLTVWDGSLWLAALRGTILWEIPLPDDDGGGEVGEPVAHLAGDYGRLRTVLPTSADGEDGLLLTTSNTDGRGEPDADDDRVLQLIR